MRETDRRVRDVLASLTDSAPSPNPSPPADIDGRQKTRMPVVVLALLLLGAGVALIVQLANRPQTQTIDEPVPETSGTVTTTSSLQSSTTSRSDVLPAVPSTLEPGQTTRVRFGVHCGAELLGKVNGRWWRTPEATPVLDWLPPEWVGRVRDEMIAVTLTLGDDRNSIIASSGGHSVTYEPGPSITEDEYCE